MPPFYRVRAVTIATLLIGLAVNIFAEQSPPESKNTIDLNGLTYAVMDTCLAGGIGFMEAVDDESYVVVSLMMKNPKPKMVQLNTEFNITDGGGLSCDLDSGATFLLRFLFLVSQTPVDNG